MSGAGVNEYNYQQINISSTFPNSDSVLYSGETDKLGRMCAVNPIYFVSQQESPLEATKWWCPGDLWTTWPHYNAINLNYSLLTTHRVCNSSIHRECVCWAPYTHSYMCALTHTHRTWDGAYSLLCVRVHVSLFSHGMGMYCCVKNYDIERSERKYKNMCTHCTLSNDA